MLHAKLGPYRPTGLTIEVDALQDAAFEAMRAADVRALIIPRSQYMVTDPLTAANTKSIKDGFSPGNIVYAMHPTSGPNRQTDVSLFWNSALDTGGYSNRQLVDGYGDQTPATNPEWWMITAAKIGDIDDQNGTLAHSTTDITARGDGARWATSANQMTWYVGGTNVGGYEETDYDNYHVHSARYIIADNEMKVTRDDAEQTDRAVGANQFSGGYVYLAAYGALGDQDLFRGYLGITAMGSGFLSVTGLATIRAWLYDVYGITP